MACEQDVTGDRHLGGPDDDHYAELGTPQPIEVVESWSPHWPRPFTYHLGEAIYMIARCGLKGETVRDLKKARWLLDRVISAYTGGVDDDG